MRDADWECVQEASPLDKSPQKSKRSRSSSGPKSCYAWDDHFFEQLEARMRGHLADVRQGMQKSLDVQKEALVADLERFFLKQTNSITSVLVVQQQIFNLLEGRVHVPPTGCCSPGGRIGSPRRNRPLSSRKPVTPHNSGDVVVSQAANNSPLPSRDASGNAGRNGSAEDDCGIGSPVDSKFPKLPLPEKQRVRLVSKNSVSTKTSQKSDKTFIAQEEALKRKADSVEVRPEQASLVVPEISMRSRSCFEAAQACIRRPWFDITTAFLTVLNAVYIGLHIELTAASAKGEATYFTDDLESIQFCFSVAFFVELLFRIFAAGCSFFDPYNKDIGWNMFDFLLVAVSSVEIVMQFSVLSDGKVGSVSIARLVRFVRIMKVVRIIRMLRFLRSLRVLAASILATLRSLVWAMLLLCIIMYCFAVMFAGASVMYITEGGLPPQEGATLLKYFGTVPLSTLTLFQTITGGLNWEVLVEPLFGVHPLYMIAFFVYVVFAMFAVLNVVTGVFCQGAIESAVQDQEEITQQQLSSIGHYSTLLRKLFFDIDAESSGTITLGAFERYMQDKTVKAYFQSLGLHVNEAWSLFKLIDKDREHAINIEDFVEGCLRMRGNAKSLEVNEMMYQNRWMMDKMADVLDVIEEFLVPLFRSDSEQSDGSPSSPAFGRYPSDLLFCSPHNSSTFPTRKRTESKSEFTWPTPSRMDSFGFGQVDPSKPLREALALADGKPEELALADGKPEATRLSPERPVFENLLNVALADGQPEALADGQPEALADGQPEAPVILKEEEVWAV
eukprot:TRINITY_DN7986_c0_g1_i1.p1 TRINITY_DN7986_c0_g1~~TRINITY_DN7986_c0_g1_i1.p1  ORF type:complete len:787 (-),score=140.13 TRINITY_DN7986_c0_g1_i1:187-2547(-)